MAAVGGPDPARQGGDAPDAGAAQLGGHRHVIGHPVAVHDGDHDRPRGFAPGAALGAQRGQQPVYPDGNAGRRNRLAGKALYQIIIAPAPRDRAELAALGFGHADLIIAVPAAWIDVDTLDDLDAVAAAFRATHGQRLRIATKYHRLVRDFLARQGVADYQLVDSLGATEGTVKNLTAEAIADITSTGETLRANHLKVLSDGLVHRSEATLYAARAAVWTPAERATLADLARRTGLGLPDGL